MVVVVVRQRVGAAAGAVVPCFSPPSPIPVPLKVVPVVVKPLSLVAEEANVCRPDPKPRAVVVLVDFAVVVTVE